MKTWTCNSFIGHYPVGTALVVTAENITMALLMIEAKLAEIGLPQTIDPAKLELFPTNKRDIRILRNGDY